MRASCPICQHKLVAPSGDPHSTVLVVGEFPGFEEIRLGQPFVGPSGQVLRREIAMAGMQLESCRVTNLWLHGPSKDEADYEWNREQLMAELKGKVHILLMGSDVAHAFGLPNVMSWSGMNLRHADLPKTVKTCIIAPNPALLLQRDTTIGEFRLAVTKFVEATNG